MHAVQLIETHSICMMLQFLLILQTKLHFMMGKTFHYENKSVHTYKLKKFTMIKVGMVVFMNIPIYNSHAHNNSTAPPQNLYNFT